MFTTLMLTALLSCKPAPLTVATTLACEGADQVRRDALGAEVGRWHLAPACQTVTCEGADWVRRDVLGTELERWAFAPQCMSVRCEGSDWVRRDARGLEFERWSFAPRCGGRPVRLTQDPKPLRFGLTSRG